MVGPKVEPGESKSNSESLIPESGAAGECLDVTQSLARWDAAEPLEFTAEDDSEITAAREQFRQISLKAVRRQMGLD